MQKFKIGDSQFLGFSKIRGDFWEREKTLATGKSYKLEMRKDSGYTIIYLSS